MSKYSGMRFLIHGEIYDCSLIDQRIIDDNASRIDTKFGFLYGLLTMIFYVIYIPFILAMAQKKYLQHSSYKLMISIGVVDMFSLIAAGVSCTYFQLNGYIYCSSPKLGFTMGCLAIGSWVGNNALICLLVFNRCLEFSSPQLSEKLFGGNRTFIWILCFPFPMVIWALLFSPPPVFSSSILTYAFFPYVTIFENNSTDYRNEAMQFNNYIICGCNVVIYIIFVIILIYKFTFYKGYSIQNKSVTVQLFLQALVICFLTLATDVVYILIDYFILPAWFTILAHLFYLTSSGITGVIYLVMNKTLKNTIKGWFKAYKIVKVTTTTNKSIGNISKSTKNIVQR